MADGAQHICDSYIPRCHWSSQGHQFHKDLKNLPLGAFNAILGMDWLEEHNPNIDWIGKSLTIETPAGAIRLQGHRADRI